MRGAGIDVGSNNVRLLAAEIEDGRVVRRLAEDSGITRLGAGILQTGALSPEGMERTLRVLARFSERLAALGITRIKAVGTSAVREASNGAELVARARRAGIRLETIDAEAEAAYTAKGVLAGMKPPSGGLLIYDIGGGSTEFIAVTEGRVSLSASVPVGVVKLADRYGFRQPVPEDILETCFSTVGDLIRPAVIRMKAALPGSCGLVGTAGAVTTAAAMDLALETYDAALVTAHRLTEPRLKALLAKSSALSASERLALPGVQKGREDLIIGGLVLIQSIITAFGARESGVSDDGLREGLAIDSVS